VVTQYALAYPEVRFTMRADGKSVVATPGNGDLRDAAAAVYGVDVAAELLPVEADGPIEVRGLAGSPAVSRANRHYISLFANRRWIRDRSLTFAVVEAYQGLLPIGRYPIAIVEVRLPPDEVDVNVHPTKAEVRFRDDRAVFAAVQRAVRRTIASRAHTPPLDARGSMFEARPFEGPTGRSGAPPLRPTPIEPPGPSFQQPASQAALVDQLPLLRPVGQIENTYVIAEGPDGLYLVDQHAAHERVLYERFLARGENGARELQPLLQPATLELTPRQRALLDAFAGELAAAGLEVEPFGEGAHIVRAVPPALAGRDAARAVGELLDLLEREDLVVGQDGAHRVAASLACHASVRAGQTMTEEEQRELLRLLEAADQPRTCPHGRPTMIHISVQALERQFGRRG
jgi:DNA mismatch repair protein MutL